MFYVLLRTLFGAILGLIAGCVPATLFVWLNGALEPPVGTLRKRFLDEPPNPLRWIAISLMVSGAIIGGFIEFRRAWIKRNTM